jgi:hypothetical protein
MEIHPCERAGINTWQIYSRKVMEDLKRYRAEGGRMNLLILGMGNGQFRASQEIRKLASGSGAPRQYDRRPVPRGQETRQGLLASLRDAGLTVGVSSHNPEVVAAIEDEGWDVDYYMTCMYRVSRTREQAREQYGEAPVGEIYMERDPERMLNVVKQTGKTCFAFKVLGAGRRIDRPEEVDRAFRYVMERIKPQDALIVGMFPRYQDEITDNVARVRRIWNEITT